MPIFQWGDFVLHSGLGAWWRIDCDAFTDSEIELFAKLIKEKVGVFTHVSCPKSHPGSMPPKLVEALKKYRSEESQIKVRTMLVVDDVASSFTSVIGEMNKHAPYFDEVVASVVFTRSLDIPPRVFPLFMGNF